MSQLNRRGFLLGLPAVFSGCLSRGVSEKSQKQNKRALLVCPYEIRKDDLEMMSLVLVKRGYYLKCLNESTCSKKGIFNSIDSIAKESSNDFETFFYYTGHYPVSLDHTGRYIVDKRGFAVNSYFLERISPYELFDSMSEIKGKKAAVIDSCHSGVYTDNVVKTNLKNYVVLAAGPFGTDTVAANSYMPGKRLGSLTYGLLNALNSHKTLNLSTADIKCGNQEKRKMNQGELSLRSDRYIFPISFEMQRKTDSNYWI